MLEMGLNLDAHPTRDIEYVCVCTGMETHPHTAMRMHPIRTSPRESTTSLP
jgi:hypothetical protein